MSKLWGPSFCPHRDCQTLHREWKFRFWTPQTQKNKSIHTHTHTHTAYTAWRFLSREQQADSDGMSAALSLDKNMMSQAGRNSCSLFSRCCACQHPLARTNKVRSTLTVNWNTTRHPWRKVRNYAFTLILKLQYNWHWYWYCTFSLLGVINRFLWSNFITFSSDVHDTWYDASVVISHLGKEGFRQTVKCCQDNNRNNTLTHCRGIFQNSLSLLLVSVKHYRNLICFVIPY